MFSYNHCIRFVPPYLSSDETFNISENSIIIRRSIFPQWREQLPYFWNFINNQGRDVALYTEREFDRTLRGQMWAFDIAEVATFFWKSSECTLYYTPQNQFTPQLLEYWALHVILPIFFTIEEKYTFLHAGAIEVEGNPILFVAPSFGGKSTMTDFFIRQGHTMISDDKVAVIEQNNCFLAVPSHPHHRPYRKMEDLGIRVENMALIPKPIHAVYELRPASADASVEITELSGIEKFTSLRYSSEINLTFLKPQCFAMISRMTNRVSIFRVNVPWDIKRLHEVYAHISEHAKTLSYR